MKVLYDFSLDFFEARLKTRLEAGASTVRFYKYSFRRPPVAHSVPRTRVIIPDSLRILHQA
jgi:hypothetical protein